MRMLNDQLDLFEIEENYNAIKPGKPKYVLAQVLKPAYIYQTHELHIPLVAIPDGHMMEATICYYMLSYGFSVKDLRKIRNIPLEWTKQRIYGHIEQHGEAKYPQGWYNPWSGARQGH